MRQLRFLIMSNSVRLMPEAVGDVGHLFKQSQGTNVFLAKKKIVLYDENVLKQTRHATTENDEERTESYYESLQY